MKEEFVSHRIALDLKELGFDEPCVCFYKEDSDHLSAVDQNWGSGIGGISKELGYSIDDLILAPTHQRVFKWFRDKHNLHADIKWDPSYEFDKDKWSDAIYEVTIVNVSYKKEWKAYSPSYQRRDGNQLTFEGAQLVAIQQMIKLVQSGYDWN